MAGPVVAEWKCCGLKMWQQVVLGLVLGIIVGLMMQHGIISKDYAADFKILGDVFLRLIKMVVAPLIFFALIQGITSLSQTHSFKGIALKGLVAYFSTCTLAVLLGLGLANVFHPGKGVTPPAPSAKTEVSQKVEELSKQLGVDSKLFRESISEAAGVKETPKTISLKEFFMNLVPPNIVHAMADDMYIQIVLFAVFTGIVMNNIRGKTASVKALNQELAHIIFKMIEWIVRLAPLAVFGFLAYTVGTTGMDIITSLLGLMALVIFAIFIQYLILGAFIAIFGKLNPLPFYKKMVTTQILAFSTTSSKATLTTAMRELQDKMGVSMSTSNFMMPLGACINMDGTAIYLGICAVFFAQMYGVDLTMAQYGVLMLTCTLGSVGAAGVPSGSIIFMGMVLSSVGLPMEGIALILGIDRILDMFRTAINITGDAAITLIVDASEGQLNEKEYYGDTVKLHKA